MTRRRLRPEEVELWQKVADQTEKLDPEAKRGFERVAAPKPKPQKRPSPRLDAFEIGGSVPAKPAPHKIQPSLTERLSAAPVQMDKRNFSKMKRGKLKPEGKLDLHGMTLDQAHPALTRFVLAAHASGKRLVLVVTGKGKQSPEDGPIPRPRGVLRHQVPTWLGSPPLAQVVLQISPAHLRHGGEGAYYVYLRRQR